MSNQSDQCEFCSLFGDEMIFIEDNGGFLLCVNCANDYYLWIESQVEAQLDQAEWERNHDPEWDYGDSPELYV